MQDDRLDDCRHLDEDVSVLSTIANIQRSRRSFTSLIARQKWSDSPANLFVTKRLINTRPLNFKVDGNT